MTKASTFSAIAAAVVALFSLASCDNSPKADNSTEEKKQAPSTVKIAYVEVDSIMTQYEFCKEYSLILEKKSQNIQSTLQQKGQALQSAAANFHKNSLGHRGLGVEGSRLFPVGFYWPDLVLWLETDMKRRVERMRVQPGLSARKQWKGSRAPVWCAYGRLHPVVWLPSQW